MYLRQPTDCQNPLCVPILCTVAKIFVVTVEALLYTETESTSISESREMGLGDEEIAR